MKQLIIILLVTIMLACDERNQTSIEGIYVAFHEHEFGATNDTLVVS